MQTKTKDTFKISKKQIILTSAMAFTAFIFTAMVLVLPPTSMEAQDLDLVSEHRGLTQKQSDAHEAAEACRIVIEDSQEAYNDAEARKAEIEETLFTTERELQ